MRILIIDDDRDNRNLIATFLHSYGQCDMASNGFEGVDAYRKSIEEKRPYQLITLDMLMPEINGHETVQKIRNLESMCGIDGVNSTKVVMISANNDYETIMESLGQCTAYIEKPLDKNVLINVLSGLGLV